jgi:hypothetical protein
MQVHAWGIRYRRERRDERRARNCAGFRALGFGFAFRVDVRLGFERGFAAVIGGGTGLGGITPRGVVACSCNA